MSAREQSVFLAVKGGTLEGSLVAPAHARGLVLFVHGSGSSRHSPRNQQVAAALGEAQLATLLFDLLTPAEERVDEITRELRFDIELLASRVVAVLDDVKGRPDVGSLPLGLFGASTGAAAALVAAGRRSDVVRAVVSRGGRPDLANDELSAVHCPTLLVVGELDDVVIALNEEARTHLRAKSELEIVPGATHLFDEPGALEHVAELASSWFLEHFEPGYGPEISPALPA